MPAQKLLKRRGNEDAQRRLNRRLCGVRFVDKRERQDVADAAVAAARMFLVVAVARVALMVTVTAERLHEAGRQTVVAQLEQQSLARRRRHVAGWYEGAHHDAGQQDRYESTPFRFTNCIIVTDRQLQRCKFHRILTAMETAMA